MKRVVILFTIFYIFFFVTNVNAAECSYAELKELKQFAQKVEIAYVPQVSDNDENASFTLKAYNMNSRMYLKINNIMVINYKDKVTDMGVFGQGETVKIAVYASSNTNCIDDRLYSFDIQLPVFNKYYNTDECKKNRDKDICKKWYDSTSISEKKFKELIKTTTEKEESLFSRVLTILLASPVAIAAVLLYLFIVIAVIIIFQKRKVKIDI